MLRVKGKIEKNMIEMSYYRDNNSFLSYSFFAGLSTDILLSTHKWAQGIGDTHATIGLLMCL